jgi:hypothetical protein
VRWKEHPQKLKIGEGGLDTSGCWLAGLSRNLDGFMLTTHSPKPYLSYSVPDRLMG